MSTTSKINPWTAKPLTEAAKSQKFRQVMNLTAERAIMGRSAIVTGWTVGGTGLACFAVSMLGWIMILPLKTVEEKIWVADQTTGIISRPVSLDDAPKIFGAATERHYLQQFIEAHEAWLFEMDERNDHVVKIMSTPGEQSRYAEWRKSQTSPMKAIGKTGHVVLENYRWHPQAVGKDGETRRYIVQYERTVWHGEAKDPPEPWTITIDFQFKPNLPMLPSDRDINPGGFQEINYTATSDVPDTKRQ